MSKKFLIKAKEVNKWDWCSQSITDSNNKLLFSVCDLCECPEDATVYRDLFNANDFIDAVHFGMQLAREGYDDIEVEWTEEDEG